MILHNVDDVLRDIKEFIRKAPASSDHARLLYPIESGIENMRKNWPAIPICLSIIEIDDLSRAEIRLVLSK